MNNSPLWKALLNQESATPYPENATVFKIYGSELTSCSLTPVEDCVVDFGNGVEKVYQGSSSSVDITNTYDVEGEYTIKIVGNHSTFKASKNTIDVIQLSNTITSCSYMFSGCSSLTSLPDTFTISNSVTNCQVMFYDCSSLTTLPNTFTIPNSVTDCSGMFYSCRSLTTLPDTFTIPNSVTKCQNMFTDCINLTSDISNIWPDFISTSIITLSYMFYNCVKVTGTIPADKLWNSGKTFTANKCFTSCTSLTNYDEIPQDWK